MIFAVFLIFLLLCVSMFLIFDALLQLQYKNHYGEWVKDGKPHGFFFIPKEVESVLRIPRFGSWLAMQRRCITFMWKTPPWTSNEPKILKLFLYYRILGVLGLIVWLFYGYLIIFRLA